MKKYLPLLFITLVGFLLRIFRIADFPPSLNWDEVSHAYNAYSIIKTGRDEWGSFLPLIFPAFGDYKLPLYIYLTGLPVFFLGLTPLATRIISVLSGSLAIPALYLLAAELFPNKKLRFAGAKISFGLVCATLLAFLPWHFFISRPALEANLSLTLIIFGTWALLKAVKKQNFYLLSALFYSLALHSYNTARLFVPLLLIFFWAIFRPKIKTNKTNILATLILGLSFGLVIFQVVTGSGTARYQKLSILSESAVFQIGQDRLNSVLPPTLSRLVHNRPVYLASQASLKYLSHFTPTFIYQKGGHSQFAIPDLNMLTSSLTALMLVGLILSLLRFGNKVHLFLIAFFLASFLPDSLTIEPAHALRSSLVIPAVVLFAGLGLLFVSDLPKLYKNISLAAFLIFFIISFTAYLNGYFSAYRTGFSASWQYGYRQAVDYISQNQSSFDRVIFTKRYGEPHIFYAFYSRLDPARLHPGGGNIRFAQSDWLWTDKIDNVYFVNDWDIPVNQPAFFISLESGESVSTNNALLITSPDHLPANISVLEQIKFLNGQPAFVIARFEPQE